jgi:hypothetical protein
MTWAAPCSGATPRVGPPATAWSVRRYDARGLLRGSTANDLTFEYDEAERSFRSGRPPGRVLKSLSYAAANGTAAGGLTDWRKGKLVSSR